MLYAIIKVKQRPIHFYSFISSFLKQLKMGDCNCEQTSITNGSETNNNDTCLYELTQEEHEMCCIVKNLLNHSAQLLVCAVGIFFNTLTILLFFSKKLYGVLFNRLLLCLSSIDNIYLIISIVEIWLVSIQSKTFYHQYAFYFVVVPARRVAMCCTIYMIVMLAVERYQSTVRQRLNTQRAAQVSWTQVLKYVGPVVIFCTLFKTPTFLEFDVEITNGTFNNHSIVVDGPWHHTSNETAPVSYTHPPSPRDATLSRMPSSA